MADRIADMVLADHPSPPNNAGTRERRLYSLRCVGTPQILAQRRLGGHRGYFVLTHTSIRSSQRPPFWQGEERHAGCLVQLPPDHPPVQLQL